VTDESSILCPKCKTPFRLDRTLGASLRLTCQKCGHVITLSELDVLGLAAPIEEDSSPSANAMTVEDITEVWGDLVAHEAPLTATIKNTHTGQGSSCRVRINTRSLVHGEGEETEADYQLLDLLGEGGMGVVYAARQTAIDRTIAVKMIRDDVASDPDMRAKFLSEAAVTGDLDHPNIVPVHDLGASAEGHLFYAMKRVRGTSWGYVMDRKTQPENLDILLRVADAVAFAHSKGIIHRDLKPDNVMLGEFGEVVLMDWGLAASVRPNGKADPVTDATALGGTPAYMAPEMAEGDPARIGVRTDVYLLGAILYEIVTGAHPHGGDTTVGCLMNASRNLIQPTEKRGELVEIALKAMATDPANRYGTVQEFQQAIRDYESHSESIALSTQAEVNLKEARSTRSYDDFAQALFGFREALALWKDNHTAEAGVAAVTLDYAKCAYKKDDLDLAESLLRDRPDEPQHAKLLSKVKLEQDERRRRRKRLKALTYGSMALMATIMVLLAVGFFWVRSEQLQAEVDRDRARDAGKMTKSALAQAEKQRAEALAAQKKAEARHYRSLTALVKEKVEARDLGEAVTLLESAPEKMRNWEWGWLWHLCDLDLATSDVVTVRCEKEEAVTTLAFSPDASQVLTAHASGHCYLWDCETSQQVAEFTGHKSRVITASFLPDGSGILALGPKAALTVWNAKTGSVVQQLEAFPAEGTALGYTSYGKPVLSALDDNTVVLWHLVPGLPAHVLVGHKAKVLAGARSPVGDLAATGSTDGEVRLWDTDSGRELFLLRAHEGAVKALAFSPDGRRLLTGGADGTVRVWETEMGGELIALRKHTEAVSAVAFSRSGRKIATAGEDGVVILWPAADWTKSPEQLREEKRERLLRVVKYVQIEPDGGVFEDSVTVALSTESPNCQVRYTLDGSTPQADSPLYEKPVALKDSATVKARAFEQGTATGGRASTATFVRRSAAAATTEHPSSTGGTAAAWPKKVRIGVVPFEGKEETKLRFKSLQQHLERMLGISVEVVSADDYAGIIHAMADREIEFAQLPPQSYVEAMKIAPVEAVALELSEAGEKGYYSLIIARKDSGIATLEQARGRTFAFTDPDSTSGYLVPMILFSRDLKVDPKEFFKNVKFSGSHADSIAALKKKTYEVVAINNMDFARVTERVGLTWDDVNVLWKSELIPGCPMVVRKDLPESLKAAYLGALLMFNSNKEGLKKLRCGGFAYADDATYDVVRYLNYLKSELSKQPADKKPQAAGQTNEQDGQ